MIFGMIFALLKILNESIQLGGKPHVQENDKDINSYADCRRDYCFIINDLCRGFRQSARFYLFWHFEFQRELHCG